MIVLPEPAEILHQIDLRRAEIAELKKLLEAAQLRRVRRLAGLDESPADLTSTPLLDDETEGGQA